MKRMDGHDMVNLTGANPARSNTCAQLSPSDSRETGVPI
jgi:hypothetical protein